MVDCADPAWLETGLWEAEAEAVHGIARGEIIAHGRGVNAVVAELTTQTRGATVLSDAPTYDTKWLYDLYRATGAEPPFVLRDFHQIAWHEASLRGRRPDIAIVKAEAEAYRCFRSSTGRGRTRGATPKCCGKSEGCCRYDRRSLA